MIRSTFDQLKFAGIFEKKTVYLAILYRSRHFTQLNCYFWGIIKRRRCANHPETEDLKSVINVALAEVEAQNIENVLKDYVG